MKNNPFILALYAMSMLMLSSIGIVRANEFTPNRVNDNFHCSMTITTTPNGVFCGETKGSITVKITNGKAPYTIEWDNHDSSIWAEITTNESTYTIPDLPKGNYLVKVRDADGCRAMKMNIKMDVNASNLTYTIEPNDPCMAAGSMTLRIAGSNPPYWVILEGPTSGGVIATTNDFRIDNLLPGNYKVIVDKDGCGHEQNATIITTPIPLSVDAVSTDNNECDALGGVKLNIEGGTAEYLISWSGPDVGTTRATASKLIQNLQPGDYTFTIRDANFCTTTTTATVTAEGTSDLACVLTQTPVLCDNLGQVGVAISGGKSGYSVAYAGPISGTVNATARSTKSGTATILSLPAGTYEITVTDSRGCDVSENITVGGQLTDLSMIVSQTPVLCDNMGQVGVAIMGGSPSYRVDYSGPKSGSISATTTGEKAGNASILDLPAGNYTIVVTDARGCSDTKSITVGGQLTDLKCIVTQTPQICDRMGNIGVAISGGEPAYRVDYTGPSTGSIVATTTGAKAGTATIPDLSPGTYTISVVDSRGCSATESIIVTGGPSDLTCDVLEQPQICEQNAGLIITVNGGKPNYTISYSGPVSGSVASTGGAQFIQLPLGNYTVIVTDAQGCSTTETGTVGHGVNDLHCRLVQTHAICDKPGAIEVIISGGKPGFTVKWSAGHGENIGISEGFNFKFEVPCPGTYTITVIDANGCVVSEATEVRQLENNLAYELFANPGVQEGNGSIEVYFQNGRSPYSVDLTGPVQQRLIINGAHVISSLPSGLYSLNITDANGCQKQQYIRVPPIFQGDPPPGGMRVAEIDSENLLAETLNLEQVDRGQEAAMIADDWSIDLPLGADAESKTFALFQNYPNPFRLSTIIGFNLPQPMRAIIMVHDHTGKQVSVFEGDFAGGYNEYEFTKSNLGAGVYYYTIKAGTFSKTSRMLRM
ncbi:MAG: T9SS type A sorting domain-containing protein [Bacteroidota bacterium]